MARVSRANLLIGLITGGALLLRLPGFTESLWFDEIWSTRVILGSVASTVRMLSADVHPPLFNVLMFFWIRVFGDSEISVRILPLVCGLATIVLTARLAFDYGWRTAAPLAALVMAISPAHIWYSQESRAYSFLMLLVVASVVAFHRIRETHDTRWYGVYAVLAAAMVFTQYFAAVYVAAIALIALTDPRVRLRLWSIGAAIAFLLAVFLAVKWEWGAVPTGAGYLRSFTVADLWRLPFEWLLIGGVLGVPGQRAAAVRAGILAVQLIVVLLSVRGLLESRHRGELALLLLGLPLGLLIVGLAGADHYYIDRTGITILPFLAVTIGIGAASLPRRAWRASAAALVGVFGTVVLINYYAKSDQSTVYKPNPDWRAAAARLTDEQARIGRPVVVVSTAPALELRYYDAGFGPQRLEGPPAPTAPRSTVREWLKSVFVEPVDPHRGETGKIYEAYDADVPFVRRMFDREHAAVVFLVQLKYWPGSSDILISALTGDATFSVEPVLEAKAIRILRIRQHTSAAVP